MSESFIISEECPHSSSCCSYVVFDEADRLFEMGLGDQLREILARLPDTRYNEEIILVTSFSLQTNCPILRHTAQAAGGLR